MLLLHELKTADARSDDHADAVCVRVVDNESGIGDRLVGGDDRHLLEARHAPRFLLVEGDERVELRNVARDARRVLARIKVLDARDAALAGRHGLPCRLGADADR